MLEEFLLVSRVYYFIEHRVFRVFDKKDPSTNEERFARNVLARDDSSNFFQTRPRIGRIPDSVTRDTWWRFCLESDKALPSANPLARSVRSVNSAAFDGVRARARIRHWLVRVVKWGEGRRDGRSKNFYFPIELDAWTFPFVQRNWNDCASFNECRVHYLRSPRGVLLSDISPNEVFSKHN